MEGKAGKRLIIAAAIVMLVLLLALLLFLALRPHPRAAAFTVASWNLQVFGDKKAGDPALMRRYADKIRPYDAVFVEEIRDADASGFFALCALVGNRTCAVSSRAGRSASKEQYGVILDGNVTLLATKDYNPAYAARFERPPWRVRLSANGTDLTVYVIHTKPDDTANEIAALEDLVREESEPRENVVVLGDLNADCEYYDEKRTAMFGGWTWAIGNGDDTNVAKSSCAFDRIMLDADAARSYVASGVDSEGIALPLSDHYLVWASFSGS